MSVTRLRLALLEQRVPQYVIAGHAGIHPSRISEYASGKKKIPVKDLHKLAAVFGCRPEDLIGAVETQPLEL